MTPIVWFALIFGVSLVIGMIAGRYRAKMKLEIEEIKRKRFEVKVRHIEALKIQLNKELAEIEKLKNNLLDTNEHLDKALLLGDKDGKNTCSIRGYSIMEQIEGHMEKANELLSEIESETKQLETLDDES